MFKFGCAAFGAFLVAGCSSGPKITADPLGFSSLQAAVGGAPVYYQAIADDYAKNDAQLVFLSGGQSCDTLPLAAIKSYRSINLAVPVLDQKGNPKRDKNGHVVMRSATVREYEEYRFAIKDSSLALLKQYADRMLGYAQDAANGAAILDDVSSLTAGAAGLPFVGPEALVYSTAVNTMVKVFKRLGQYVQDEQIRAAALELQPQIRAIITALKKDYGVLGRDAHLFLNAWQACTEARFELMRSLTPAKMVGGTMQTAAIVDLDQAFGAYLDKKANLKATIPNVDTQLDAIAAANKKLAEGTMSVMDAVKEMQGLATDVYNAYQAARPLQNAPRITLKL
ncbi:hypothetical protein [Bradyrhizobium canariense]|uniref:hypothetical protein n=1 Tax=Bradyrhizobium canariense TaxID=255045 RepID=UPI001B8A40EC|nr:hypothetical protein [Bradyrhizobium canariense]MBR0953064.1 hypothetical protein [Bradyrhizobium canariense]